MSNLKLLAAQCSQVLDHYEHENVAPFKILGITLNRDLITMLMGVLAGSLVGMLTKFLENISGLQSYCFCHDEYGPVVK